MSIPVVILCGGLGTRLGAATNGRGKTMVDVHGVPFLEVLVRSLDLIGYKEFSFLIYHKAEEIIEYPWNRIFPEARFSFLKEKERHGPGFAVLEFLKNEVKPQRKYLFLNGDTFIQYFPKPNEIKAIQDLNKAIILAVDQVDLNESRANLQVESDLVLSLGVGDRLVDCGALIASSQIVDYCSSSYTGGTVHSLLEPLVKMKLVSFHEISSKCFDIGTPARLQFFMDLLEQNPELRKRLIK